MRILHPLAAILLALAITGCSGKTAAPAPSGAAGSAPAPPGAAASTPAPAAAPTDPASAPAPAADPAAQPAPPPAAAHPQAAAPSPPATAKAIAIYRDGKQLPGQALERNGTLYLPLSVLFPNGKQPALQGNLLPILPGYSIDVAASRYLMRAGEDDIFPALVAEGGLYYAPLSFFRFQQGLRAQYDPTQRRVTLSPRDREVQVYDEEIPDAVKRWAEQLPRDGQTHYAAFTPESGGRFWVFARPGGKYRFHPTNMTGPGPGMGLAIIIAGPDEAGSEVIVGTAPRTKAPISFRVWFDQGYLHGAGGVPGVYIGPTDWDQEQYDSEVSGRVQAQPEQRSTPLALVRARAESLGIAAGDKLTVDEAKGLVYVAHAGETFVVRVKHAEHGWILQSVDWA